MRPVTVVQLSKEPVALPYDHLLCTFLLLSHIPYLGKSAKAKCLPTQYHIRLFVQSNPKKTLFFFIFFALLSDYHWVPAHRRVLPVRVFLGAVSASTTLRFTQQDRDLHIPDVPLPVHLVVCLGLLVVFTGACKNRESWGYSFCSGSLSALT